MCLGRYGQVADHGGLYEIEVILDRGDTVLPHYRGECEAVLRICQRKVPVALKLLKQATCAPLVQMEICTLLDAGDFPLSLFVA